MMSIAAFTSAAGLFFNQLYKDNTFVQVAWQGNDCVTLMALVPALLVVLFFLDKGSAKVQLIWCGLLGYFLYNYAFYLFGAVFNVFFLLYVSIFSIALFTLIIALSHLSAYTITASVKSVRWISIYLALISLMLCLVEIPPILLFIATGKVPDIIEKTNHPTGIVYALDLSLVVPTMMIAAILLWRYKTWGYILSTMMLIKGFTYGLVLTVGTVLLRRKLIEDPLLPLWIFITVGGLVGLIFLLTKMRITKNQ